MSCINRGGRCPLGARIECEWFVSAVLLISGEKGLKIGAAQALAVIFFAGVTTLLVVVRYSFQKYLGYQAPYRIRKLL
jgi:hypothetical protein